MTIARRLGMRLILVLLLIACSSCGADTGPPGGADAAAGDAASIDATTGDAAAGDAALGGACAELDLATCRQRTDCVADTCLECSCAPVFGACRAVGAPAFECPQLGCLQPSCCHDDLECETFPCAPPGTESGCGFCFPGEGTCATDTDCSGEEAAPICEPIHCACDGGRHCVAGCETTGCGVAEVCDENTHRCAPMPCKDDACPANYSCGPSLACQRTSCATDLSCGEGWCVNGLCYDSLGLCMPPAA